MLEPLDPELAKLFESPMPVYGTVYTAPIAAQPLHVILYNELKTVSALCCYETANKAFKLIFTPYNGTNLGIALPSA
jgi:hypothetical protein